MARLWSAACSPRAIGFMSLTIYPPEIWIISKRSRTALPSMNSTFVIYQRIAGVLAGAHRVFHLAGLPSVPKSILDPVASHESNIDGTFNVFRAAAEGPNPITLAKSV